MGFCFLLADDDTSYRHLLKKMLIEDVKFIDSPELLDARDGAEALTLFEKNLGYIDLIFSDLNMPGMSGLELLREVRARDPRTPFILLSGQPNKKSIIAARDAGVTAIIVKPFSPAELRAKLEAAIASTGIIVFRDSKTKISANEQTK